MPDPLDEQPDIAFDAYVCPDCGDGMSPDATDRSLLTCVHCGRQCAAPASDFADNPPAAKPPDDELSAVRIRQLSTARRAAYRARSYAVMAAAVCVMAVVQLVWLTIKHVRSSGWGKQPIGYVLFTVVAILGVWFFLARAVELHREAKKSALAQPTAPPDFSTLDDGSKRWKSLEDLR